MENAIIVGAGTYGTVYLEYLKPHYNVIGFIDDNELLINQKISNLPVLGDLNFLLKNIQKGLKVFAPIGNNKMRVKILKQLNDNGFLTPSFIHPNTLIHESVKIGKAVYILPGTQIMPLTVIKDYVMISMGVNIAHHNTIDEGCFFSQGSNIGASIHIKSYSYWGISSTAMTGIHEVGSCSLIGAGSVVTKDVPDNAVIVGVPGKILKYKH